jgi:3-oxoacyl-[acyl-carrier-protein] synthase-3
MALHEAIEQGRLQPGKLVVFVAFGAGLTWGGTLIRW